jgi:ribonucleotide reductase beta subunit family protein with ferritin-like domain
LNKSLEAIHFKPVFENLDDNLLQQTEWFNLQVSGKSKADFFDTEPVTYAKGNKSYNLEDVI